MKSLGLRARRPGQDRPGVVLRAAGLAAAVVVSVAALGERAVAAFAGSTTNAANAVAAASLTLTGDDTGTALFNASGLVPGVPLQRCLQLSVATDAPAATVRVHGSSTGVLAAYLDVTVEAGSGGSFSSCAGFVGDETAFTGTLAAFAAAHGTYDTGVPIMTTTGSPATRTLRFTVAVRDEPAAQSATVAATFTVEARA